MLTALATILGLRHTLPTGLVIAALLIAFGPQLRKLNQTQPTQQSQVQQVQQLQAPTAQAQQAPQAPTTQAQQAEQAVQKENSLQENIKVLELDEEGFNWRKDWWKYVIMALSVILLAYLALKVTNMLFRTVIVTLCIAFGLIGSLLASPVVTPLLERLLEGKLPAFLAPSYISYALCFLVCYLLATAITNYIIKPGKRKNDAKAE